MRILRIVLKKDVQKNTQKDVEPDTEDALGDKSTVEDKE
jgi:hypothetical protein